MFEQTALPNKADEQYIATVLQDRCFLVVGMSDNLPLYQHIRALGVKMILLDAPSALIQSYLDQGLIEAHIEADMTADKGRLDRALNAIRNSYLHFEGILTFVDVLAPLTAQLAEALSLPGHPTEATYTVRSGYEVRKACLDAGIPTPRFVSINSAQDLAAAAKWVGFPATIKPLNCGCAADSQRVDTLPMLQTRYHQMMDARFRVLYDEVFMGSSAYASRMIKAADCEMILEEHLEGQTFNIDCLLSYGEMVFSRVTSPSACSLSQQAELAELAQQVLAVLGFRNGIFHIEANYTSHGPRLVGVQMGGSENAVYEQIERLLGIDLLEQYLLICLGLPVMPPTSAVKAD